MLGGFEFIHHQKTTGHLPFRAFSRFCLFPKRNGGVAHAFLEQRAKRTETLKTDFEAHVSDAQFVALQELFGLLDATFYEVLVRSLVECLAEQAQKVIARETGFLGDLIQVERMVVAMIDKLARASEPPQGVKILNYGCLCLLYDHGVTLAESATNTFATSR